jgi:predicted transposase/invertase (TIGR01784 family)
MHTLELAKVKDFLKVKDEEELKMLASGDEGVKKAATLELWLRFLKVKDEEELKMLVDKDEGIKKAATRLMELSADETARAIREAQIKARRDHFGQIAYARQEGREEGREEGRRATAQNLLRLGVALDTIITATGLSEEEILALQTTS